MVRFDLVPLRQGQTMVAKPKLAYNSLIIGSRVFGSETNLYEILGWNLLKWSDLALGPSFKVKQGYANLKVPISLVLLLLGV